MIIGRVTRMSRIKTKSTTLYKDIMLSPRLSTLDVSVNKLIDGTVLKLLIYNRSTINITEITRFAKNKYHNCRLFLKRKEADRTAIMNPQ